MMRIRFGATTVFLLAVAAVASAQPGKPPAIIQFKQFGATPEQFYQSSVTRWTGQLALDLEAVKAEIAAAKLVPAAKAAVIAQADVALRHTAELDGLVAPRGRAKDKLFAEFAEVEKSLTALALLINQNPVAKAGYRTRSRSGGHRVPPTRGGARAWAITTRPGSSGG